MNGLVFGLRERAGVIDEEEKRGWAISSGDLALGGRTPGPGTDRATPESPRHPGLIVDWEGRTLSSGPRSAWQADPA